MQETFNPTKKKRNRFLALTITHQHKNSRSRPTMNKLSNTQIESYVTIQESTLHSSEAKHKSLSIISSIVKC